MILSPNSEEYSKCIKAFNTDDADADADYKDESSFYIRSDVKPDKDYLLTGIWKKSFSEFSTCIEVLLKRLGAIISLDTEIEDAVTNGYKALINNKNKRKCCTFYCSDALKYCYIHLRIDSSTLGFGFRMTVYCADKLN